MLSKLVRLQPALYEISVRQCEYLRATSFRFHLTVDTLVFGCILPTTKADSGLSPVRNVRRQAHEKESLATLSRPSGMRSIYFISARCASSRSVLCDRNFLSHKENSAAFGYFPGSCAVCWPLRHDKDNYRARFLL